MIGGGNKFKVQFINLLTAAIENGVMKNYRSPFAPNFSRKLFDIKSFYMPKEPQSTVARVSRPINCICADPLTGLRVPIRYIFLCGRDNSFLGFFACVRPTGHFSNIDLKFATIKLASGLKGQFEV